MHANPLLDCVSGLNLLRHYEILPWTTLTRASSTKGPSAEKTNVTTKHVIATREEHAGLTAKEIFRDIIILEAKRTPVCSDFSMKEIAYKLGFIDPPDRCGCFKKAAGTSRTKHREQNARSAILYN